MRVWIHRIRTGVIFLVISMFLILPVWAAEPVAASGEDRRVFDEGQLLSTEQIQELEEKADTLRRTMRMDVVMVTTADAKGKDAQTFADDYYDQGGFGTHKDYSGVLFLIDIDNRQLQISTSGAMIRFLTDSRLERMLDETYPYVQSGNYADAMNQLLKDLEMYYQKGIPGGQYNYNSETGAVSRHRSITFFEGLLAVAVAAFCGGGACANVKRQYAMKRERGQASNYNMAYRANAQFAFHQENDVLANSHVTQQIIPRSTGSSSGGGRSGGMGGGRSSTHSSGSGRSHGGGGRGF